MLRIYLYLDALISLSVLPSSCLTTRNSCCSKFSKMVGNQQNAGMTERSLVSGGLVSVVRIPPVVLKRLFVAGSLVCSRSLSAPTLMITLPWILRHSNILWSRIPENLSCSFAPHQRLLTIRPAVWCFAFLHACIETVYRLWKCHRVEWCAAIPPWPWQWNVITTRRATQAMAKTGGLWLNIAAQHAEWT